MTTKRSERAYISRTDKVMISMNITSGIVVIVLILLNMLGIFNSPDGIMFSLAMVPIIMCICMGVRSYRDKRRR